MSATPEDQSQGDRFLQRHAKPWVDDVAFSIHALEMYVVDLVAVGLRERRQEVDHELVVGSVDVLDDDDSRGLAVLECESLPSCPTDLELLGWPVVGGDGRGCVIGGEDELLDVVEQFGREGLHMVYEFVVHFVRSCVCVLCGCSVPGCSR